MSYSYIEHNIDLPATSDVDVNLRLPNGRIMVVQYRIEGGSIDICLPENTPVVNWQGDDMEPAIGLDGFPEGNVRMAKQLMIELDPKYLEAV